MINNRKKFEESFDKLDEKHHESITKSWSKTGRA